MYNKKPRTFVDGVLLAISRNEVMTICVCVRHFILVQDNTKISMKFHFVGKAKICHSSSCAVLINISGSCYIKNVFAYYEFNLVLVRFPYDILNTKPNIRHRKRCNKTGTGLISQGGLKRWTYWPTNCTELIERPRKWLAVPF